jgi:hypothetical protein
VLERVTGIEPALSAWEAEVLPLNYTRTVVPAVLADRRDARTGDHTQTWPLDRTGSSRPRVERL